MRESNERNTKGHVAFAVLFPLVGAIICGFATGPLGFGLGLILLYVIVVPIIAFFLIKRNSGETWDGEVIDLIHMRSDETADIYRVVCRTDEGKTKKVDDKSNQMYSCLHIGDRVRFHPLLTMQPARDAGRA